GAAEMTCQSPSMLSRPPPSMPRVKRSVPTMRCMPLIRPATDDPIHSASVGMPDTISRPVAASHSKLTPRPSNDGTSRISWLDEQAIQSDAAWLRQKTVARTNERKPSRDLQSAQSARLHCDQPLGLTVMTGP